MRFSAAGKKMRILILCVDSDLSIQYYGKVEENSRQEQLLHDATSKFQVFLERLFLVCTKHVSVGSLYACISGQRRRSLVEWTCRRPAGILTLVSLRSSRGDRDMTNPSPLVLRVVWSGAGNWTSGRKKSGPWICKTR